MGDAAAGSSPTPPTSRLPPPDPPPRRSSSTATSAPSAAPTTAHGSPTRHPAAWAPGAPAGRVGPVRGRLHFMSGERRRTSSWIFLEWSEREIQDRFGEFSAVELWHFVEALDG